MHKVAQKNAQNDACKKRFALQKIQMQNTRFTTSMKTQNPKVLQVTAPDYTAWRDRQET